MYLLIFEAWATLCGFTSTDWGIQFTNQNIFYLVNSEMPQGAYLDNGQLWLDGNYQLVNSWYDLAIISPPNVLLQDGLEYASYYGINQAQQALMLANIMTHVSMILIFIFFISFIIFLFRLFAHMLSRR